MICDKIYEYLGGTLAKADDGVLDAALRSFRASLVRNLTDHKREARTGLHASSPWYCARRVLYQHNGADTEPLQPRARVTFLMGDTVEAFGIFLARLAGVDIVTPGLDGKQERHEIAVGTATVDGSIDMTVRDSSGAIVPVDWKSMSEIGFGEFEQAVRDPSAKWWERERWGYITQLRLYMKAKGSAYGVFVGLNKNTGAMAELHVPRDLEWESEVVKRADYLKSLMDAHAAADSIPRPPWATTDALPGANQRADGSKGAVEEIAHWRCRYCPFIQACWLGFEVVPLKSGPKWRKAVEPTAITNGTKEGASCA